MYPGDSDMALDLQESKDREKNLGKRYSDLFMFILNHIRFSHVCFCVCVCVCVFFCVVCM